MEYILEKGRPADEDKRSGKEVRTYDLLEKLGIEYERVDHEAAFTIDACVEIDKALAPASLCKNLLLCNNQKTKFYLLMIRDDKKFKTKEISGQINSPRLSFAPGEFMEKFLDITPGSLSVLGLMNDHDNNVTLLVDTDVLEAEYVCCHPCVNTSSLRIKSKDIFEIFCKEVNHDFYPVVLIGIID